jgi:hypothetical protein
MALLYSIPYSRTSSMRLDSALVDAQSSQSSRAELVAKIPACVLKLYHCPDMLLRTC